MTKPHSNMSALESWIGTPPADIDVTQWQIDGYDLWPLLKTTIITLAILSRVRQSKSFTRVGDAAWRAAVRFDHVVLSALRRAWGPLVQRAVPTHNLSGQVVFCGSQVHAREVGEIFTAAPLDVPAILLRRKGQSGVFWFYDIEADDERLTRALNAPAFGVANILRTARARAWRIGTNNRLRNLRGYTEWCRTAATFLGMSPRFLTMWLTRQVNLMLAAGESFGQVFDQQGRPDAVIMLNGGFWETAGLTAAARRRSIPVVEIQHGVDSMSAVTAAEQSPDFWLFNTAPDAFVAWEMVPRPSHHVLCVGPIGLHLPILLETHAPPDPPTYEVMRAIFREQAEALERRAARSASKHEILVSMQPMDDGEWIGKIASQLPSDVFFWCRRHGFDAAKPIRSISALDTNRVDFELASTSALTLLLERVGAHLTRFSAVTLEACVFNVATVATEPDAQSLFSAFVPPNYLTVATVPTAAAAELMKALERHDQTTARRLPEISGLADFILQLIPLEKPPHGSPTSELTMGRIPLAKLVDTIRAKSRSS